ncbi:MAG TPA: hypothetical protein VHG10_09160 [Glycomyces sp.]|nr:hypothetical protein [Glycomyces sp.]
MSETQPLTYDAFTALALADPTVVGLVLFGSQAHEGMPTEHSDHDLWVVLSDSGASDLDRFHGYRSPALDLVVTSLADFKAAGMPGFVRYALARGRVVLDRAGGEIAAAVAAKQRLEPKEAFETAAERLDDYANMVLRSVKNHRDGRRLAARLDAAESIGYLLELLFALERRPRPYNKHLEWELARYPLPQWDSDTLLDTIGRITAAGEPMPQRRLFAEVEAQARQAGHSTTLDAWGDDLHLMRPDSAA